MPTLKLSKDSFKHIMSLLNWKTSTPLREIPKNVLLDILNSTDPYYAYPFSLTKAYILLCIKEKRVIPVEEFHIDNQRYIYNNPDPDNQTFLSYLKKNGVDEKLLSNAENGSSLDVLFSHNYSDIS